MIVSRVTIIDGRVTVRLLPAKHMSSEKIFDCKFSKIAMSPITINTYG
jgi:hypothetical protein